MKEKLHNIPLWFINLITVISGIITIITPVVTIFITIASGIVPQVFFVITVVTLSCFTIILFMRMKKYRTIANNRMEKTSDNYHRLLHYARDLYFQVMHNYKKGTLTISGLSELYRSELSKILDLLCNVMNAHTERNISSCIKLITYPNDEEVIFENNAQLVTFCRSNNSDTNRENYEQHKEIWLTQNTDFLEIISNNNNKNYFYQGDLEKYAKQLHDMGRDYENSNTRWSDYYKGTVIVPIRIEFKKLYHQKKDDAYHIIGFLCIDSLSTDAFTEKQEKYNVDIVKSFADIVYILLGQYRHYLKKLDKSKNAA